MNTQTTVKPGTVYHFDFSRGKLVPIENGGLLPVGQLVTYEDMANPRKNYVVTGATFEHYGQDCVCEDGHKTHVSKSAIDSPGGWRLGNRILNQDEIAAFLFDAEGERIRIESEHKRKAEKDATERAALRVILLDKYPFLERRDTSKKSGHALAAANIRKLLKREFPNVTFRVTSDSYSMGCSVDVRWTDGPTSEQVRKISDQFQECDFDGMTDSTSYRHTLMPELFGGAKYVHESRDYSAQAYQAVARKMGFGEVPVDQYGQLAVGPAPAVTYEQREMIQRETYKTTFPIESEAKP